MAKDKLKPKLKDEEILVYTQEQSDFVDYYIQNRLKDGGDAWQRSHPGCSESAAHACASRALKQAKVQALLKQRIQEASGMMKENLEHKILEMWFTRAFYDPGDILDDMGRLKMTMSELKRSGLSVCIEGVDVKPDKDGGEHFVYKLADREKALDNLQKYIAMIKPQPTLNLNLNKDAENLSADEEALYRAQIDAIKGVGRSSTRAKPARSGAISNPCP